MGQTKIKRASIDILKMTHTRITDARYPAFGRNEAQTMVVAMFPALNLATETCAREPETKKVRKKTKNTKPMLPDIVRNWTFKKKDS